MRDLWVVVREAGCRNTDGDAVESPVIVQEENDALAARRLEYRPGAGPFCGPERGGLYWAHAHRG